MLIEDLDYYKESSNFKAKNYGMDSLEYCDDKEWFIKYPIQDFDYDFNSWGFRGSEYSNYLDKEVNICLGCSFTVNLGGPIEHSWPSLLQEYYNIPCLNLGMDGAGNDAIYLVYQRAKKIFRVKNVFVVYTYFHRRMIGKKFIHMLNGNKNSFEIYKNIEYFRNFFIPEAKFQFIPYWCYTKEENDYISKLCDPYIERLTSSRYATMVEREAYQSRDGHHLNLETNQKLANNLYNQ